MSPARSFAILCVVVALACGLAASTYSVFGHTWDEPEHLAAGMALVDTGTYPYDTQHPPLARVAMAMGPWLAGAHSYGNPGPSGEQEGRDILYRSGHYDEYLTLARIGMLPFLALLVIATWAWTRHTFGDIEAIIAALFLATTPPIIGHGAVAALDVPMAATTMLAMYMLVRWFEAPHLSHAIGFGIAAGIAAGTKLSSPPFLIFVTLVWFAAAVVVSRRPAPPTSAVRPQMSIRVVGAHAGIASGVALMALVLCYGFSFTKFSPALPIPVPVGVPRLIDSLNTLLGHNTGGHLSFFWGELRRTGWWNFYIIAIGVKTPLPMLILGMGGLGYLFWRGWRENNWILAAPSLAFVAILFIASAISHINIGVRHVIVLFPLIAMGVGVGVVACWRRWSQGGMRLAMCMLIGWQLIGFAATHPDDLAYFNALAGPHPERILVDSDLDWGQDIRRLENALNAQHIREFSLVYRGTVDLPHESFPHYRRLWPGDRVTGWIAVSLLAKATDESGGYKWLDAYRPVMRIGKSIDLYYIEDK